MNDDLGALLRAELGAECPPPLGDLVAAAMRDGRRVRQRRRAGLAGAGVVLAAVAAVVVVAVTEGGMAAGMSPGIVPTGVPTVPGSTVASTLTVRSGTQGAGGMQKKATSAAMLHLLTTLLPPGRTSRYGAFPGDDLRVGVALDGNDVRVALTGPDLPSPRPGAVRVTVTSTQGDCSRATEALAAWPDGTTVEVDVPACAPRTGPALTSDQAVRIAADPRWGVRMQAALVDAGAQQFPGGVPVLS